MCSRSGLSSCTVNVSTCAIWRGNNTAKVVFQHWTKMSWYFIFQNRATRFLPCMYLFVLLRQGSILNFVLSERPKKLHLLIAFWISVAFKKQCGDQNCGSMWFINIDVLNTDLRFWSSTKIVSFISYGSPGRTLTS